MAIWSLTHERIEKLRKQMGDKEEEIDRLVKLSPKDLWTIDLDEFLEEWQTSLADDAKRAKKNAAMGRRTSAKLGVGAAKGGRKRKADSDDDSDGDFEVKKTKKKAAKAEAGGMLGYLAKKAVKSEPAAPPALAHDGAGDEMDVDEPVKKAPARQGRAVKSKAKIVELDSDEEDVDEDDVFEAVAKEAKAKETAPAPKKDAPGRRTASKKTASYNLGDDSEDDDGDDMLGNINNMVKGINDTSQDGNSRFLFSNSRPASQQGLTKLGKAPRPSFDLGEDDTDYSKLIPKGSPLRPAARTANDTILSGDEDDSLAIPKSRASLKPNPKATTKAATKAAPKVTKKAAAKKAAPAPEPEAPKTLSPAAKAYAAKQAKGKAAPKGKAAAKKKAADSDDDDDDVNALANDILSDDDASDGPSAPAPKGRAAAARPGRRAAATKKPTYAMSDSEDDASEPDFDDDDSD
jgi:DNA topoisomerase II